MFDSQPTKFDLRFNLFGFPVRVHPLFWLIMALLGRGALDSEHPLLYMLIWIGCGFSSILLHELGHAFMYRWFGSNASIALIAFGGYAQGYLPTHSWKRIVVFLAGPLVNLLIFAIVYSTNRVSGWAFEHPALAWMFFCLYMMNLFWAIINLLPIYPLDGGRVLGEVCTLFGARNPNRLTHQISIAVAGSLAAYGALLALGVIPLEVANAIPWYLTPTLFMSLWFALFAYMNYQHLQQIQRYSVWNDRDDDTPPWRR